MGKGKLVAYGVLVSLLFCLPKVALSQHEAQPVPLAKPLHVKDIAIPASLGYVLEATQPKTTSPSGPIVIHIQEAHTNHEAQKNIVAILQQLTQEHGLRLILVEGGEGDVSLAYLRNYGTEQRRREVAEKYLRVGIISAEEYLDITSDKPLTLWGVEQESLYEQNVEAFLDAEALHGSIEPVLAGVRAAAEALRPHLAGAELNELDAKAAAFERHALDLPGYIEVLERLAGRVKLALAGYPNISAYLTLRRLEAEVELPRVQQEQQALLRRLSQHLVKAEMERLIDAALAMKQGRAKPAEFYPLLQRAAESATIPLATEYPHLHRYIAYLAASASVDATKLPAELDRLSADLRVKLADNAPAQALSRLFNELDLAEKLLNLRLSPDEHRRLQSMELDHLAETWRAFLDRERERAGLPKAPLAGLEQLSAALPKLQRFYEVAQQRDEVLVRNTVAKLRETGEPLAVLITGGFHSPAITQQLKDQGIGMVVMTPKVGTPTDERLYMAVVKYKSGRGSFDDVMAIAGTAK